MKFKKISVVLLANFLVTGSLYGGQNMQQFILDGTLSLYFPKLSDVSPTFTQIMQKSQGVEYNNMLERLRVLIHQQMSVNVFNADEARSIGLNDQGAAVYVHLDKGKGYSVFTIANEKLLKLVLSELTVPYRIIGNYVIFSSSKEILEYEDFKGISARKEFQRAADALGFRWDQNFLWINSAYLEEKNVTADAPLVPQGDWTAGVFEVTQEQVIFNLYTIYKNPRVNDILKQSATVLQPQMLSFLDFEFGQPAIVGQIHLNFENFLKSVYEIDIVDTLGIQRLISKLETKGVDIFQQLLPYLSGRLSYTVREFNLLEKRISITATAQVKNKQAVFDFISGLPNLIPGAKNKTIFTQNIFGWSVGEYTIWIGLVEDHFIFSTDESSMLQFVQNVYEGKKQFLRTLPFLFRQFIRNRSVGGQMYIKVESLIYNMFLAGSFVPLNILTALDTIQWNFYFDFRNGNVGRHDIIVLKFI